MIKFFKKTIPAWLIFLPYTALGSYTGGSNLRGLMVVIRNILSDAVVLLVGFAVVFFIYGITRYITAGEDEDRRTKMKNLMIYGIIGLFVMVSFWGIVNILINTFELDTSQNVKVPYFEEGGTSGSGADIGNGSDESWNDLLYFYGADTEK